MPDWIAKKFSSCRRWRFEKSFITCPPWSVKLIRGIFYKTFVFAIYCRVVVNFGKFPIDMEKYGQNLAVITNL